MRRIFSDKQHGLGKQVLNIAVCEFYEKDNIDAFTFFCQSSNYELSFLYSFDQETAKAYF
jgi:hypothetical protein